MIAAIGPHASGARPWRPALRVVAARRARPKRGEPLVASTRAAARARPEPEGPDPKLALQQRSCAAVLDVVRAQGAYQPSHAPLLGAALLQADFLAGPGGIPADRAVLAELVQLGWAELDTLPAGDAVHLLSAAAGLGTVTPEQLQAWLAAFNARGGLRAPRLFSSQRLELLEAALRLRQTGTGLALPPKLLGGALARLLAPGPVTRLSLAQLARAYTLARELGMWPTAEQHAAAAAAAAQRAEQGEFSAARVAQLLRLWAEMEREHVERNRQARGRRQPEPWRSPISGYPGDETMASLLSRLHKHRHTAGSWALGQVVGALGELRYVPPQEQLADLLAALQQELVGPQQAREATAALLGLGKLGLDPGEKFAAAIMRLVEADGGRDPGLLAFTAWTLAICERCTPERWRTLVGLLRRSLGQGDSSQLAAKLSRKEWQGALSPWLTAYLLARQQDGTAAAAGGGESSSGQPTLAAGEEEAAEPLPAEFLAACVSKAAAERRKKRFAGPGHARAAKVVSELCGPAYDVQLVRKLKDPATGAPMLLDVALPGLKFGVQLGQPHQFARNTGAPVGSRLVLPRLAQGAGWELAVLPQEVLGKRMGEGGAEAFQQALSAYLREQTRLPQLLAEAALGGAGR